MSRTGSMGLAMALLMAMTSTASAQGLESKDGPSSAGSASLSAGSAALGDSSITLSGDGMIHAQPPIAGWCGTDTTLASDADAVAHRIRLTLVAAFFHSGLSLDPVQIAMKAAAFRRWYQSSIDVLPG